MSEPTPLPIPDSYWVIPDRFLAGEYPGSWDQERTRGRMGLFLEAGINTFIDLTSDGELPLYAPILKEQSDIYKIPARHQRFSIGDFSTPSVDHMASILDTLDKSIQSGLRVYVHCWGGVGRTGTTVGCYLVRHGKTGEEALSQLAEWWQHVPKHILHPRSPETDEQVRFILDWKAGR